MKRITYFTIVILVAITLTFLLSSCVVSCSGFEKETFVVKEQFRSIEVDDVDAKVIITPSLDGKCRVTADEKKRQKRLLHSRCEEWDTIYKTP